MFSVTIREKSGQVYTFHFDKPEIMIGRVKGNDVILPKQNISKRHALVRARGDRFIVEDLGSTNGTYVNGHRIASPVEITSDDKVYLGDFVMQFFDLGDHLEAAEPELPEPELPEVEPLEPVAPPAPPGPPAPPAMDYGLDLKPPPAPGEFAHRSSGGQRLDDGGYEAGIPDRIAGSSVLDAQAENTMAELDGMAAVSRLMSHRRSAEAERAGAVAADDPRAAMGEIDDRMTGPVDGMAELFSAEPPPGPRLELDLGPALADDAGRASKDAGLALERIEPERIESAPPGSAGAEGPTGGPKLPTEVGGDHHGTVAALYDRALDELHLELPRDAATLSDAQWSAMEQRVVAFVDAAVGDGDRPDDIDLDRVKRELIYEIAGLGPLEAMLDDTTITAIEVNGPERIFVVRGGLRSLSSARFSAQPALLAAAERLINATGTTMRSETTHAEGALVDGTSIRVVWPPLCPGGPALLIRKPRPVAPKLEELVARGQVTERAAERLLDALAAGRSIALCGLAGSGRRTVLNAIALELPDSSRVVVAEHGARIRLDAPHIIRIDTASGAGAGGADSPLRVARSLDPDRLLVCAEGRDELTDLVCLAGGGLPPWVGAFFAHSAEDLLRRAIDGLALHHAGVSLEIARSRVATTLDVVASFSRGPDGRSVLDSVGEVRAEQGGLVIHSLLSQ